MNKLLRKYLAHKKITIPATIVVAGLIVGGVVYGVNVSKHNAQLEKANEQMTEVLASIDYSDAYNTAVFQLENSIMDDTEREDKIKELTSYEDKVKDMSDKDAKDFVVLLDEIEKTYLASEQVLTDSIAELSEVYPTEEDFYDADFTSKKDAMMEEINALMKDGKYKDAGEKFNELNTMYSDYAKSKDVEVKKEVKVSTKDVKSASKEVSTSYDKAVASVNTVAKVEESKPSVTSVVKPSSTTNTNTSSSSSNTSSSKPANNTSNTDSKPSNSSSSVNNNTSNTNTDSKPSNSSSNSTSNTSENKKPAHTHKYTKQVTKEPTCTATGTMTYTCSCGNSYTETIAKKDHDYSVKEDLGDGYCRYKCSMCGVIKYPYYYYDGYCYSEQDYKMAQERKKTDAEDKAFADMRWCENAYDEWVLSDPENNTADIDDWARMTGNYDKLHAYDKYNK